MKLIKRFDYLLLVDEDAYIGFSMYIDNIGMIRKGVVDDEDYWAVRKDYYKIIALLPSAPHIPTFDLPLLPSPYPSNTDKEFSVDDINQILKLPHDLVCNSMGQGSINAGICSCVNRRISAILQQKEPIEFIPEMCDEEFVFITEKGVKTIKGKYKY